MDSYHAFGGWAGWVIQWIIHPAALIGIPLVSLWMVISTVADAFSESRREAGTFADREQKQRKLRYAPAGVRPKLPENEIDGNEPKDVRHVPEDLGVRALAAALLPFVALMFAFVFQSSLFNDLASYNSVVGFLGSLAIGFIVPFQSRLNKNLAFPLSAFCFSAVFSVLIFSYAAVRDTRIFVFYYGFALGALAHVAFVGLPGRMGNR